MRSTSSAGQHDAELCVCMQGEIDEKDTELSTVKSDREKLEKEMQTMLQKEKEDIKVKGKGPGGMLHSALQQLQRELRREAVANEKLMVKAESLLKDGKEGKPRSSKSFAAPNVATTAALLSTMKDKAATMKDMKDKAATMKNKAATMKNKATTMKEEKAASEANEEAKVDEEQEDSNEEENEEQEADVLPVGCVACPLYVVSCSSPTVIALVCRCAHSCPRELVIVSHALLSWMHMW